MHATTAHAIYLTLSSPGVLLRSRGRKPHPNETRLAGELRRRDVGTAGERVDSDLRCEIGSSRRAAQRARLTSLGLNKAGSCEALGVSMSLRSEERR
jgi:hypothetical protein